MSPMSEQDRLCCQMSFGVKCGLRLWGSEQLGFQNHICRAVGLGQQLNPGPARTSMAVPQHFDLPVTLK